MKYDKEFNFDNADLLNSALGKNLVNAALIVKEFELDDIKMADKKATKKIIVVGDKNEKSSNALKFLKLLQEEAKKASGKNLMKKDVERIITEFKEKQQASLKQKATSAKTKIASSPEKAPVVYKTKMPDAVRKLFEKDRLLVEVVQRIFDVKVSTNDAHEILIKPATKAKGKGNSPDVNKRLTDQTKEVLDILLNDVAKNVELTKKSTVHACLYVTEHAENVATTRKFLIREIGQSAFDELTKDMPDNSPSRTALKKVIKFSTLQIEEQDVEFAEKFTKSKEIQSLFEERLKVTLKFKNGTNDKNLVIEKKANCKYDLGLSETVINYACGKYRTGDLSAIEPLFVENCISNVLNKRSVDFVPKEQQDTMNAKLRLQSYKLKTFNENGKNQTIFPKTESQCELYDAINGKPSKDFLKSYKGNPNKYVAAVGPAASGKTSWLIFNAVNAFKEGVIDHIILTRPMVAVGGQKQPALPGGVKEKTLPYLMPLYENMKKVMPESEFTKYFVDEVAPGTQVAGAAKEAVRKDRSIRIVDITTARGLTFENAILIIDEGQNLREEEVKLFGSRISDDSKMLISLDLEQIDLQHKLESGAIDTIVSLYEAKEKNKNEPFALVACKGNLRSPAITAFLNAFDNNKKDTTTPHADVRDKSMEQHYAVAKYMQEQRKMYTFQSNRWDENMIVRIISKTVEQVMERAQVTGRAPANN